LTGDIFMVTRVWNYGCLKGMTEQCTLKFW